MEVIILPLRLIMGILLDIIFMKGLGSLYFRKGIELNITFKNG